MNTPEFQAFLDKQAGIYGNFAKGMALAIQEGTTPDPVITGKKGGYLLFLRPSHTITQVVAEFSREAAEIVSGLVPYDYDTIHTTISDYSVADNFMAEESAEHANNLLALSCSAKNVKFAIIGHNGVSCSYAGGFVFNKTTLILQGIPNETFLQVAKISLLAAAEKNVILRMPWGSHITAGRFSVSNSPEQAAALAELCQKTNRSIPPEEQLFRSVGVGWFTSDENGFNLRKVVSYNP